MTDATYSIQQHNQYIVNKSQADQMATLENRIVALEAALAQPESHTTLHDVCQEVLRLEKINANLLEALKLAHATLCGANMNEKIVSKKITAAIAKAEEQA
jgi:hypothetical protein